jgi:hypothetical protein
VARELRILLTFRLSTDGRDPRRSVALVLLLAVGLGVVLPVSVAAWAPDRFRDDVTLLSPTLWAFVLVSAVVASLASAGGRELLPRREAVALPVSATADQLGALLLTPLNVAWSVQAVGLLVAAAYVAGVEAPLAPALVATALWLLCSSAVAQLLGWAAELLRTVRHGLVVLRALAVLSAGGALLLVTTGRAGAVLDKLPTTAVFVGSVASDPWRYLLTQALVLLALCGAVLGAVPLAEALERRPAPSESAAETAPRRRTATPAGPFRAAVRTDVRSILRSPPLRRGLLLLLATPVGVSLLLQLPWVGITVLPALVASGAALMHGVNVVALDGRGALWRESLPHDPDTTFAGRLAALAVLCGGSAALLVVLAGLRAAPPSTAELTAAVVAVPVATAQVVSRCARWSVRHPHPADLRRARDTPAPPLWMARYSLQLSLATTLGALLIASGAVVDRALLSVLFALALLVPSLIRLSGALRAHRQPVIRSRVVATVTVA